MATASSLVGSTPRDFNKAASISNARGFRCAASASGWKGPSVDEAVKELESLLNQRAFMVSGDLNLSRNYVTGSA